MVGTRGKEGRMVEKNETSSDYIEKLVSIEDLILDPKNPRQEIPNEELIESVRKDGVKEPLITLYNNGKYWICDGWERYQAGVQAGLTEILCHVYTDHIKALKATKEASIVNPWTDFQKYKFCKIFYDACMEKGMTHKEALQKTFKELPYKKKILLRYLSIFELPLPVQSLMKEERNLTENEVKELQKHDSMIKLRHKKLGIKVAHAMTLKLKNFPKDKICEIAVDILGMKSKDALRAIDQISQNPDIKSYEIIKKIETGYGSNRILHVGDFIVEPELKEIINHYVKSTFNSTKMLIKRLLEDWVLLYSKSSILINAPKKGEIKEIKDVSFKVRGYNIKILQISGSTVIRLEGTPSLFFAHKEVKKRKWNEYRSIPKYIKNFLNSIRIEFKDKNQIDKKKTQDILEDKLIDELLMENKDLIKQLKEKCIEIEKLKELQRNRGVEDSK